MQQNNNFIIFDSPAIEQPEIYEVVDSFANKDVLKKVGEKWRLKPSVVKGLEKGGKEFTI